MLDRIISHKRDKYWFQEVKTITLSHYSSRGEVEIAEREAIKAERPKFNIDHNGKGKNSKLKDLRNKAKRRLFKEAINRFVSESGKSWSEAAYELGICHTAISRWKNGKICPTNKKIEVIERWSEGRIKLSDFTVDKLDKEWKEACNYEN
jgi:ribosome-binding protein aMBF1 (putative translation factor)